MLDYGQAGLLHPSGQLPQYSEDEIERLGLIDTLVKAGFASNSAVYRFVSPEQLRALRIQRSKLLGELRGKQQYWLHDLGKSK